MSEHYDGHRHDARDLAVFAAGRGLPMTPERAYRAWASHSDSMAAGWMRFELDGEEGDLTYAILEGAEARLQAEDAAFLHEERRDVDLLYERAEAEGYGLSREDVARIWADHSATQGRAWADTEYADLQEVLEPHRNEGPGFPAP